MKSSFYLNTQLIQNCECVNNKLRSKLAVEQSSLIGRRRSKVSVDFAPPPFDGGSFAPQLAHSTKLRQV